MLSVYGPCGENATAAGAIYVETYPQRNQPSRWTFQELSQSLRDTKNFNVTNVTYPRLSHLMKIPSRF